MTDELTQLLEAKSPEERKVMEQGADIVLYSVFNSSFGSTNKPLSEYALAEKVRLIQELDAAPRGHNRITAEDAKKAAEDLKNSYI